MLLYFCQFVHSVHTHRDTHTNTQFKGNLVNLTVVLRKKCLKMCILLTNTFKAFFFKSRASLWVTTKSHELTVPVEQVGTESSPLLSASCRDSM